MPARDWSPNVKALTRAVALRTVRFVRTSTQLFSVKAGDVPNQLAMVHKAGGAKSPDAPTTIRALLGLECALKPQDSEREIAKLTCDLALDYLVQDDELFKRITDQDCIEFASLTGHYNAWPYMREFCQNASLRMGLPVPILLPTLPPPSADEPGDTAPDEPDSR